MTNRRVSDNANTVSLFPFLAVLLCTMGSLLVLLVVLAQRATEQAKAAAGARTAAVQATPIRPIETPSQALDLAAIRREQVRLEQLLANIETQITDEKLRLGHLEDHNRRVEHDLAELYIANEQLKAIEDDQQIDQVQAEQELARLKDLIAAAKDDLETAEAEYSEQPAKTLVVYRGPNGTTRPPVYIECNAAGVTLQPEGVTLEAADFATPLRAGNALALAVRATQDYASHRQIDGGEPLDTPYPLVIVRPGGRKQFNRVVRALTAADLRYGYEFLGADAVLEYADPDPSLAEVQHHAVLQARSRQELLAMAAPSRFGGSRRYGGGGSGTGLGGGGGFGQSGSPDDGDALGLGGGDNQPGLGGGYDGGGDALGRGESGTGPNGTAGGPSAATGDHGAVGSNPSNSDAAASANADSLADGSAYQAAGGRGGQGTAPGQDQFSADPNRYDQSGDGQGGGSGQGSNGSSANGSSANGPSANGSSASGSSASGAAAGSSRGSPSGGQGQQGAAAGAPSTQANQPTLQAEATARSAGWAVGTPPPGAVAMRRPIRVIVGRDRLAVQPSRHRLGGGGQAQVVSLDDHPRRVLDEFSRAIRDHMQEWGLAGRGMHWRPVVVLEVEDHADEQARQLARALERSGVDVQLPSTADARTGGPRGATR